MSKYARTLDELRRKAVLFWTKDIRTIGAQSSVLPVLLDTQDKFISVLNLSDKSPDSWKHFVDASDEMRASLFLKHLMVLSDLGGEALNKFPPLSNYFQDSVMKYVWREQNHMYRFKVIGAKTPLTNSSLRVNAKGIAKGYELTDKMEDAIMLLLHGAASIKNTFPDDARDRCMIGSLMGYPEELSKFVKQSYIRVSRQVAGATSNAMGRAAQDYVLSLLSERLPEWSFVREGKIPGISHSKGDVETTFDIVAKSPLGKYFAVEVSFQFTTNSVIERKAGQAQARANLLRAAGHHVCYVIDGAGNINVRTRAVGIICANSDCTVAFSPEEIGVLADYMVEVAGKRGRK